MTYHYLAFFMGLFGSIHCAVMCGPLLIALQADSRVSWLQTLNKVLYQFGRILTYTLVGAVLGIFGNVAVMQGWQQTFSIITGIFLIIIGLIYCLGSKSTKVAQWQTKMIQPFAKMMGKWLYRPGGSFIAGILNGLLPCGMVYMAIASSINADGVLASAQFMLLFGLGTLPLMLIFSLATSFSKQIFKLKFAKILPVLFLVMGVWFILRGSNLNIPYLSPLLHLDGAMHCL